MIDTLYGVGYRFKEQRPSGSAYASLRNGRSTELERAARVPAAAVKLPYALSGKLDGCSDRSTLDKIPIQATRSPRRASLDVSSARQF